MRATAWKWLAYLPALVFALGAAFISPDMPADAPYFETLQNCRAWLLSAAVGWLLVVLFLRLRSANGEPHPITRMGRKCWTYIPPCLLLCGCFLTPYRPPADVWVVAAIFWLFAAWLINLGLSMMTAPLKPEPGYCRVCGYDLRATPHRCPECGTVFNSDS